MRFPVIVALKPIPWLDPSAQEDGTKELVPEAYLDNADAPSAEVAGGLEKMARDLVAFNTRFKASTVGTSSHAERHYTDCKVTDLFDEVFAGEYHALKDLDPGSTPVISCQATDNGVEGFYEIPDEHRHRRCVTISANGAPLTSFFHPYEFAAKDDVILCTPKKEHFDMTVLFIVAQLNRQRWRYSYGRKCYMNKIEDLAVPMPLREDGTIDEDFIARLWGATEHGRDALEVIQRDIEVTEADAGYVAGPHAVAP